uniref:Endonuclease/exonuclease/phosphatase domain-containing protein n=1 Tax=Bombyx mori TaxID=7091 RepID=A0A8R2LY06_BOMMO|nr:craniofacial development protein 2-like [Bombyx mori]
MIAHRRTRPLVPGGPAIPGYGSGHGNGGARGAKNPRQRSGYHPPSQRQLALVTYNVRTLRLDEKLIELEEEMNKLRWDVIGLSEIRREGEDTKTLQSGHLFYYREGEQKSQGGVGFIVHKSLINNIVAIESVSSRVVYLVLKISKRYSLKIVQVYAPSTSHPDDEVEATYEDISRAIRDSQSHFTVVMGDFNAKLGRRGDDELKVGPFGFGQRNPRGQMLADFMEKEGLFMMNSFFKKPPQRKWTWLSPDGVTRNEIDFIMSTNRQIFNDVSVINSVKTGSDHRIVRGMLNINVRLERSRLMKSTLRPSNAQIQNPESFQLELANRFEWLNSCTSVDDVNSRLVETVRTVGSKFFKTHCKNRPQKLSDRTRNLMASRRLMTLQTSEDAESYRQLNRHIMKSLRHDLRSFNTQRIKETIERNQGSKVFARDASIGQSQLTKLKTEDGRLNRKV